MSEEQGTMSDETARHIGHGEGLNLFIGRVPGCPACDANYQRAMRADTGNQILRTAVAQGRAGRELADVLTELDRLSAENERLREALEAIAGATTIADAVPEVRQFARDALANEGPTS